MSDFRLVMCFAMLSLVSIADRRGWQPLHDTDYGDQRAEPLLEKSVPTVIARGGRAVITKALCFQVIGRAEFNIVFLC